MIFIDAHVHIYSCYDLDVFFDSAFENFSKAAKRLGVAHGGNSYVLLLAESGGCRWFEYTATRLEEQSGRESLGQGWEARESDDPLAVAVHRLGREGETLRLVAGHQIVTGEKLEVLALFCRERIADGLSLEETAREVKGRGGIAVAPWGAGKWLGRRGKILRDFLLQDRGETLFLGGSGGQPRYWPTSRHLSLVRKMDIPVLSGSDPLPLPQDAVRAGSYGFAVDAQQAMPSASLRDFLVTAGDTITPFGTSLASGDFWLKQLQLRVRNK